MIRRLLAALVALVGTAGVVVVGLATFFPEEDRFTFTPSGPVRSVEVDVDVGEIQLVAGTADAVFVERTRRYLRGTPAAEESLVDGVLRIRAACPRFVAAGCEVDYRIEVPAGVAAGVRTQRGSVLVQGIAGMVAVDTSAGRVRLARTGGPLRINTSAGNVDAEDITAEFVDATTGAGRIRMSLAEPPGRVGLRTGAGNIVLALPETAGRFRVDAEAGAGRVDVGVANDPGASRAVIARSGAGNITIRPR